MRRDRNGMGVLTHEECLLRLGRAGVGRVAVSVGALPAIFPVAYAQTDGDVYFRTAPGTKLAAATCNAVVAFEVDHVDAFAHAGWSVLVVGPAAEVTDPEELSRLRRLPLARWASGGPETLVRIRAELVSGRELSPVQVGDVGPNQGLPFTACPTCGSDALRVVTDGELTNVVCTSCLACWHTELGVVYQLPAGACPGCGIVDICRAAHAG